MFRLYNRNGKITSISASERDEPHLKISDEIAAKLMDSKRNPDDWLFVGSRLQRIGEARLNVSTSSSCSAAQRRPWA